MPEADPVAEVELDLEVALGTTATVLARSKARGPNEVVRLGGGILVQGDEARKKETPGKQQYWTWQRAGCDLPWASCPVCSRASRGIVGQRSSRPWHLRPSSSTVMGRGCCPRHLLHPRGQARLRRTGVHLEKASESHRARFRRLRRTTLPNLHAKSACWSVLRASIPSQRDGFGQQSLRLTWKMRRRLQSTRRDRRRRQRAQVVALQM